MANRIKDALEPEVYDYYKQHRSKYKRFASDITLLNARLLQGMMADGVLPPKTKKEYNWEREHKCIYWLYNITGKSQTFDDFRKIFKDRLRNFKFKSPEYYDECERIIQENDVEFVEKSIRAESIRNFVAKSYDTTSVRQTQLSVIDQTPSDKLYHNSADGKYDWHIESEPSYSGNAVIQYLVTKHHRECLTHFQAWDIVAYVERKSGMSFECFCAKYKDYLSGLYVESKDFAYQCYVILLEEQCKATPAWNTKRLKTRDASVIARSASNMLKPIADNKDVIENIASNVKLSDDSENSLEWLKLCFGCVLSFFAFGGIAYVLKHLIALAIYLVGYILWCICNIIYCIVGGILNFDIGSGLPLDMDNVPEPLTIWQIGGWIYGSLMVIVIVCTIANRKEFDK